MCLEIEVVLRSFLCVCRQQHPNFGSFLFCSRNPWQHISRIDKFNLIYLSSVDYILVLHDAAEAGDDELLVPGEEGDHHGVGVLGVAGGRGGAGPGQSERSIVVTWPDAVFWLDDQDLKQDICRPQPRMDMGKLLKETSSLRITLYWLPAPWPGMRLQNNLLWCFPERCLFVVWAK